ncbi:hypothetical protein B9Z55_027013 [Caenorhabditis nigoni]|uniref:Uncharacterized protein n=1 Tax=Caenorhabditis nigoni TaxID=1611254 RepID=A0A2G5SIW3_9PELO|nr:hypothetical protein B9Z55_027013 [Caenorhabditis nigoni]
MSQALSSSQPSFVNGSKSFGKVKNCVDSYPVFFRTTICFAMYIWYSPGLALSDEWSLRAFKRHLDREDCN